MRSFIYQTEQIRAIETLAFTQYQLAADVLMQRAGEAAFAYIRKQWPEAKKIAVLCGAGNNGGDGGVLALLAKEAGLNTQIWQVGEWENQKSLAKRVFDRCLASGVSAAPFSPETDLNHYDLLIDAILGIGLKEAPRDSVLPAITALRNASVPILSLDIPSGVNADTGVVMTEAVSATVTLTFIAYKLGLLTGSGISYAGEVVVDSLNLPNSIFTEIAPAAKVLSISPYLSYLQARPRDWHKGLSGHVVIAGGELGFSGAPRMAAEAALRVGAGLVSVITKPEHALVMNIECPEIMCHGFAVGGDDIQGLLHKADVLVLGPGLGQTEWSQALWKQCMTVDQIKVIDADGLNLLARENNKAQSNAVFTPHPGEAARLLGTTATSIQKDRLIAGETLLRQLRGTVVLKGAGTIICSSDSIPEVCTHGNPGMASAGLGDVLSGVIAGLIAQGIPLRAASSLGVYIHATAGDLAAGQAGERGLIAMDLMPFLRQLVNPEWVS